MVILLQIVWMAALGISVGVFSAGLGLGGGVLMVPAFITFLPGMDMHTAKGTSLFIILIVATTGFFRVRRLQEKRPHVTSSLNIVAGALLGGGVGASLTAQMSEDALLAFFLAFVVFLMARLVMGEAQPFVNRELMHRNALLFFVGFAAGAVGSATGTGGGSVLAPLILLTGLLPHTQLVYTANQVMIATSLAAAPVHFLASQTYYAPYIIGHVYLVLVPVIVLSAQVGILIGARVNKRMGARQRRLLLAWVLALVAFRIFIQMTIQL